MNEFLSSSHPAIVARTLRACKKGDGRGWGKVEVVEMEDGLLNLGLQSLHRCLTAAAQQPAGFPKSVDCSGNWWRHDT